MKCPDCGSTKKVHQLRLIKSGRPFPMPKYIPQIKTTCGDCERFLKFTPQDDKIIDFFNDILLISPVGEMNGEYYRLRAEFEQLKTEGGELN